MPQTSAAGYDDRTSNSRSHLISSHRRRFTFFKLIVATCCMVVATRVAPCGKTEHVSYSLLLINVSLSMLLQRVAILWIWLGRDMCMGADPSVWNALLHFSCSQRTWPDGFLALNQLWLYLESVIQLLDAMGNIYQQLLIFMDPTLVNKVVWRVMSSTLSLLEVSEGVGVAVFFSSTEKWRSQNLWKEGFLIFDLNYGDFLHHLSLLEICVPVKKGKEKLQ